MSRAKFIIEKITAIARKEPSLPMKFLSSEGLLKGEKLDFGSGRGKDARTYSMDEYDPQHKPEKPTKKYDTITCNYVLNTISKEESDKVLSEIRSLLKPNGNAYISVRRDVEEMKKSSYTQRNVKLSLPVLREESGKFCIYHMKKGNA